MSGGAAMSRNSIPPSSVGQANVLDGTSGTCMSRNSSFTLAPTFQEIVSSAVYNVSGSNYAPAPLPLTLPGSAPASPAAIETHTSGVPSSGWKQLKNGLTG